MRRSFRRVFRRSTVRQDRTIWHSNKEMHEADIRSRQNGGEELEKETI